MNMTPKTSGSIIITFAWVGSGGGGLSFCWRNISAALMMGRM